MVEDGIFDGFMLEVAETDGFMLEEAETDGFMLEEAETERSRWKILYSMMKSD